MTKICLITGATSGIGEETAKQLSELDFQLILCGRNQEKLNQLSNELSSKTEIITLKFDVRDKNAVQKSISSLPFSWQNIQVLINNAGNAHGLAHLSDANYEDLDAMIDGNVKGLMYVTKAVLPMMIKAAPGHIINISSIAGKSSYENGVGYCASKHAVEAVSEGLRLELVGKNIKVSNIAPGAVSTNFSMVRFKGNQSKSDAVYSGYQPLVAKDIADLMVYMLQAPEHVNLADVLILPKAQASAQKIFKIENE